MYITGIAHTAYTVSNIEESLHFYRDILGFEQLFELELSECNLVYLRVSERQFIELFHNGIKERGTPVSGSYGHLCLEVSDIFAMAEYLKEKGVKADGEPSMGLDFNYQLWITDPDGNRIELMQYGEKSLQFSK